MRRLDFYYDVGSPNAYLAWRALSATPGVELAMHPVLIGGLFKIAGNQPPWMAHGDVPTKMSYLMAEITRFATLYAIPEFKMNPHFPVNTLLAMRAATAARMEGVHDRLAPALMSAMWEERLDLSQPEEMVGVAGRAGLDGHALVAMTTTPEVKQALMDATQACADRGVFGLPTWFDQSESGEDGEMFFGKDCVWMMHPDAKELLPN